MAQRPTSAGATRTPARAPSIEPLLEKLRAGGERITTARRAVLEALVGDHGHLSTEEVAARVQHSHPDIHLSTVYRTLDFLTEAGIVVNVRLGHGPSTYHFASDVHHHAVCRHCHREIELPPDILDPVVTRLANDFGFDAHPHHLTIEGLCADCRPTIL